MHKAPPIPTFFIHLKTVAQKKRRCIGMGLCTFAFTFILALATCLTDLTGKWLKEWDCTGVCGCGPQETVVASPAR